METNNKTIKLPLQITKETTSTLMGLDWMERLGIHLNTIYSEKQIHDVKMDDTERKTVQLKHGSIFTTFQFKDLFLQQYRDQSLISKY